MALPHGAISGVPISLDILSLVVLIVSTEKSEKEKSFKSDTAAMKVSLIHFCGFSFAQLQAAPLAHSRSHQAQRTKAQDTSYQALRTRHFVPGTSHPVALQNGTTRKRELQE